MNSRLSKTSISALLLSTALIIATALPLQGQIAKSYVPALQARDGADLGLALLNPTLAEAQVTLTARDYTGAIIQNNAITNPVTLTLPASGQVALRAVELFGSGISGQTGWVEVSASTSAVKGLFSAFDSGLSFVEVGEFATPASRLIFPKVSGSLATELSLVNIGPQAIQATLSLYSNDGQLFSATSMTIPAFSGFTSSIDELAPSATNFEGYAVMDSGAGAGSGVSESLVGFETYRNRSDIAFVRAFPESARLRNGFLAHLVSQGGYSTKLTLVNFSGDSQVLRITADGLQSGGSPQTPPSVTVERTLAPNARLEESVEQMFNLSGEVLIDGYIHFETETNTSGVIGLLDYGTTDGVALSAVEAQGEGYSNLVFSQVVEGAGFYTGLALLNPNSEPSIVTLDVFDTSGNRTGSTVVNLTSGEREARLLSEFLQSDLNQFGGFVRITATRPIFALELFGSRNATFLAGAPAQGESLKPQTSGRVVDASVGANVISDDGSTSLLIPSKALTSNSSIKVEPISVTGLPLASGARRPISAVEATPAGTQFQIPVRLTFPVNAHLDPGTKIPLLIFDPQTGTYQATEFVATVDKSGRTASAEVTHFTQYVASIAGSLLTISNITPTTPVSPGDTITITGTSFCTSRPQTSVTFAGSSNTSIQGSVLSLSATSIQAQVPSGAVTGPVVVRSCKQTSTGYNITVASNAAPGTISLSPSSTIVGTLSVTVQIAGTGFMRSSVVNYDGAPAPVPPTFVDSTLLNVTLGPFSTAAIHHINVVNPAPGGGTSNTVDFTVTATKAPVAAFTYSPSSPVAGSPVSFNGSSSTCYSSPCSYNWTDDADSSVLGTGATMSFTFGGTGTKYVRLTITDALSQTASVEHDVIVSSTVVVTSVPTITSFTPASGPTGTSVTISGTNFTGATAVLFNGVSASFTVSSATAIQTTVPAGATTGSLKVTTPGGTATSTSSFTVNTVSGPPVAAFTYSPSSPVTGSAVSFNGSSSTCYASPCSYNWTDDADSSVLGTGATMSFTFGGIGTKYVRLTITDALSQTASVEHDVIVSSTVVVTSLPTITSFTPASGPTGTSVTISGTNFTGATAVLFNSVSASFTVSSATAIQATVPTGATTGPLTVTTPGGTATSASSFTVSSTVTTATPPTITGFTPTSGPTGNSVTISGTGFTGATAVRFNGVSATFTVSSATAIQATVPAGATTGPLSLTTPGGTATSASSFTVGSSLGSGNTYYVSNSGNDSNSGTSSSSPWKTIAKVRSSLGNLRPGDNVLFQRGGIWYEELDLQGVNGTASARITFGNYGTGNLPIIDGGGTKSGTSVNGGRQWCIGGNNSKMSYITIDGFECRYASNYGIAFFDVYGGSAGIIVQNSYIHDIGDGDYGYHNALMYADYGRNADGTKFLNNRVGNCYVHNCVQIHGDLGSPLIQGNEVWGGSHGHIDVKDVVGARIDGNIVHDGQTINSNIAAFYIESNITTSDVTWTRNVVYGNILGVAFQCQNEGAPISCYAYNNTVYTNTLQQGTYGGTSVGGAVSFTVKNNIFDTPNPRGGGGYVSWDYNDNVQASTFGSHDMRVNPLYVSASGLNFHLQSGSPVIGAGTNVGLTYSGSAPDLGAFQH